MAMRVRNAGYFLKEGLRSSRRNALMSLASIGTVALSLLIFGMFLFMILNANNILNTISGQIVVVGYINDGTSDEQIKTAKENIEKIQGVKQVEYISKEKALENFSKALGDDDTLTQGLDKENPLPASFEIKVIDARDVSHIAKELENFKEIDTVKDGKSTADKLIRITDIIKSISVVLMTILGIIAIFLIANTIKITVYARKREIQIMKYAGATDWFIKWPFIIQGMFLGICGAIISLIILCVGYSYLEKSVNPYLIMVSFITFETVFYNVLIYFLAAGMAIGGIGSLISVKKFLVV